MGMLGAGLGIIGGIMQGMGQAAQYKAAARAHKYNAMVAERNAGVIRDQGDAAIADQQLSNLREYHMMLGRFSANGASFTGSAYDVLLDTVHTRTLDVKRIEYKTQLALIGNQDTQNLEEMGADDANKAASFSMVSGIINGLASGLSSMPSGGFGGGVTVGGGNFTSSSYSAPTIPQVSGFPG